MKAPVIFIIYGWIQSCLSNSWTFPIDLKNLPRLTGNWHGGGELPMVVRVQLLLHAPSVHAYYGALLDLACPILYSNSPLSFPSLLTVPKFCTTCVPSVHRFHWYARGENWKHFNRTVQFNSKPLSFFFGLFYRETHARRSGPAGQKDQGGRRIQDTLSAQCY